MVVSDPAAELLEVVRSMGDPAPCRAEPADGSRAALIRRRFGLALPPPFVEVEGEHPVRAASGVDAAAIAALRWRSFGIDHRGLFPDRFLDERGVVPPISYWIDRAASPAPEGLLVWGRPGTVLGYLEFGPSEEDRGTGEITEVHVDPCARGRGGGADLLDRALAELAGGGRSTVEVSVFDANTRAHAFYRRHGFEDTGRIDRVDVGVVTLVERRFRR